MIISQTDVRTLYELQPVVPLSMWWQSLLVVIVALILVSFVIFLYRRDARGLPIGLQVLLATLRVVVLVAIAVYLLNPGKRSETRVVKPSRLAVLIDTSLSMGLSDEAATSDSNSQPSDITNRRRIDEVIRWMNTNQELVRLREEHEITVYRFGDGVQPEPLLTIDKTGVAVGSLNSRSEQLAAANAADRIASQRWIGAALILGTAGLIGFLVWMRLKFSGDMSRGTAAWTLCGSMLAMIATIALLGIADLRSPQSDLWMTAGLGSETSPAVAEFPPKTTVATESTVEEVAEPIDWSTVLAPRGTSTQLGSALQFLVNKERGGPIAGIVVITDGRSNAGVQPARAIAAAANAGIPVFPVGIGSTEVPKNVLVADIQVPPKVFPDDKFQVKGIVKSFGLAGQSVSVQLLSSDVQDGTAEIIEDEQAIRLLDDSQPAPIVFNVSRQEQGKRRYSIRVQTVTGEMDVRDNQRSATVEIIERQTKVLLLAGGPNREFRFLRNQLFRDKDVLVHVLLQSSQVGADQEGDLVLTEFPRTKEEMYFYDCVVAFDPDWRELSAAQAELLERWVAEQAGGLVVVAGPVNTPEWTRRSRGDDVVDRIRRLYPVSFYSQGTAQLKLGRFGGDQAFPLDFSREGRAAEFLWIGDTAADSQANWSRFEGVFGYYAVNEPKPGADILANFADPATAVNERLPIYLASHFYGGGRVFFQASSEMWRVRRLDVEFFQEYYTKLIRWASQGRLLRDSTRGLLLTDRQRYWMGDQVGVQAILRTPQDEPLLATVVQASVLRPDGTSQSLELLPTKNAVLPGTYNARFIAGSEGDYRVNLPIPGSPDFEVLTTTIGASIPDLEKEQPERNDAVLLAMAEQTNGHFFVGIQSFRSADGEPLSPLRLIPPQDQETYLAGTVDRFFQRKLMQWLLALVVIALSLEWITRRLHKLA